MGDKSKVYRLVVAVFFFLSGFAVTAYGGERTVYGPEVFARAKGKPQKVLKTFTVPNQKWEYNLSIESEGISSAVIEINGAQVVGPSDFNKQVEQITKSIKLQEQNEIAVEVRSEPGTSIVVTVKGTPVLPPDPGEAGKLTLEGIDSDSDGVRDDIQRYIFFAYPDEEKVRIALTQVAIEYQALLPQANDPDAAFNHATRMARHDECLFYIQGETSLNTILALQAEFLNTRERSLAYISYSDNLAGKMVFGAPVKDWKNSCNFDVDAIGGNQ